MCCDSRIHFELVNHEWSLCHLYKHLLVDMTTGYLFNKQNICVPSCASTLLCKPWPTWCVIFLLFFVSLSLYYCSTVLYTSILLCHYAAICLSDFTFFGGMNNSNNIDNPINSGLDSPVHHWALRKDPSLSLLLPFGIIYPSVFALNRLHLSSYLNSKPTCSLIKLSFLFHNNFCHDFV